MLTFNLLTALLAPGVLSAALHPRQEADLDGFIKKESAFALKSILANIGADGSAVSGAGSGLVIASPSKSDPDCKLPSPNRHDRN
jgi:glucoamylase